MHMFYRVMKGIYQFAANLLSYIPAKYYWNRSTSDLVIAKSRRVNFFLKHSVYCPCVVRWKVKVASSLTYGCLAATVWAARYHSSIHHSLSPIIASWKPHQYTRAWRHRLKPSAGTCYQKLVRGVDDLKQHLYLIQMWSATSRAVLINGEIVLMHVSKPIKANTLNVCNDVFVRTCHDF